MMLTDKDFCAALSDVFVDNQIYYKYIISVVKNFPIEDVEKTLLRYVTLVYYSIGSPV